MREKRFSIVSIPELLPITPRSRVGKFLLGTSLPRWVLSEEFLVDTPPEEGRDVVPVGVGR